MRRAENAEADAIRALYDDAAEYANSIGFIDWPMPFPLEAVQELIADEELFVWDKNEELAAAAKVSLAVPEKIWGVSEENNAFVYLGKLAGSQAIRGTEYIQDIVMNDINVFASSKRKRGVRLDCLADNLGLCTLYASLGYQSHGVATFWSPTQQRDLTVHRFEIRV